MSRFILPRQSVFNINGQPLPGATLDFHNVGLLTDKNTYSDEAKTTPNTNPVVADGLGSFPDIWLDGDYDVTLKDAVGVIVWGPIKQNDLASTFESTLNTATTATMTTLTGLTAGTSVVSTAEFSTGNGGGGIYDVISGTGTANGYNIIAHDTLDLSFVLRKSSYGYAASQVGCGTSDDTLALSALATLGGSILIDVDTTLKPDTEAEISLISNTKFLGLGVGVSNLIISESTNPSASKYGLKLLGLSNVSFEHLTIKSDAAAQGIFNLGTLTSGVYGPDQEGKLYGLRISQCDDIRFNHVAVEGFNGAAGVLFTNEDSVSTYNTNVKLTHCDSRDNRETGFSLQAIDGFEVFGGIHERNGLQVFDVVDSAGDPTSTTRTATNFIDGGTGYGIVLGRSTSATKLKPKNGVCSGVRTRRNVRHGIDIHAGSNIEILDCHSEDDLLSGFGVQDSASSLDGFIGDIKISGGSITHTAYAENRGYLFDDRTTGVERDDSVPLFVSNTASEFENVVIDGVTIRDWRFRQITSYSSTDVIMAIAISANKKAIIRDCTVLADNATFYPSKILSADAGSCIIDNNSFTYGIRGTFDRAAFRFNSSDNNTQITNNTIKEINIYSASTTQVARSVFDRVNASDIVRFVGNDVTRTTQGTKGSLCETASGNAQTGYNGFWGVNKANILDGEIYAEQLNISKTFYISSAGSGNQDGSTSGNSFAANNLANLQLLADQLPNVTEDQLISLQFADGSYTLIGTLTIPFDGWQLLGNATEFSSATTKSVDFDNSAASDLNIVFPKYGKRSTMKGIQTRSANGLTVRNANILEFNVIENSASGAGADYGFFKETGEGYANSNYFTGGYAAIGAFENASLISRVNSTTGTNPTYGINVNGGVVMKNSTQPTGATANELASNGGVIR